MTDFLTNRQRVSDTDGLLLFLTVSSPSFTDTLRLVADTPNWDSNGQTFIGAPFGFKLPDDTAGQSPRAQLTMNNAGRGVSEELELLGPGEVPDCLLEIADRSDPDTIAKSFPIPMTNVSVSGATVTANLGVDYLMRGQAVRLRAGAQTVARP